MGARNVLVSMGKDGALLVTENEDVYISNVAKGEVENSATKEFIEEIKKQIIVEKV